MPLPHPLGHTSRTRGDAVLVWRDRATLQVGIDDDVLVLGPVPRLSEAFLQFPVNDDELLDPSTRRWREWLAGRLTEHQRLAAPFHAACVRIVGSGRVAGRLATALLDLGHTVRIQEASHASGQGPTGAERLVAHLRRSPGRGGHRVLLDTGPDPELTVLATGTCEPERSLTDQLTREGRPYVVLRTRPGRAVAGPLVVPSETSCLRCADLWRAEADPVWPRLAAQLAHRQAPVDPVLDAWVTGLGLAAIVAFLDGEAGELRSRTLTLASDTGRTSMRLWPAHPRCTCHEWGDASGLLPMPDRMGA